MSNKKITDAVRRFIQAKPNTKIIQSYTVRKYTDEEHSRKSHKIEQDIAESEVQDIILTRQALYVIDTNAMNCIQLEVELRNVKGISFSLSSNEFMLHVKQKNGETDYRYI